MHATVLDTQSVPECSAFSALSASTNLQTRYSLISYSALAFSVRVGCSQEQESRGMADGPSLLASLRKAFSIFEAYRSSVKAGIILKPKEPPKAFQLLKMRDGLFVYQAQYRFGERKGRGTQGKLSVMRTPKKSRRDFHKAECFRCPQIPGFPRLVLRENAC